VFECLIQALKGQSAANECRASTTVDWSLPPAGEFPADLITVYDVHGGEMKVTREDLRQQWRKTSVADAGTASKSSRTIGEPRQLNGIRGFEVVRTNTNDGNLGFEGDLFKAALTQLQRLISGRSRWGKPYELLSRQHEQ
jgi:hypothetical protein